MTVFSPSLPSNDQVRLVWDVLGETVKYGDKEVPRQVFSDLTVSLDEKSNMRKLLQTWRGKAFTPEELKGFDLRNVLGTAPDLTIEETVKLFAELRCAIDDDTVIRFSEGTAIRLDSDDAVSSGEVLELLQQATVNCLITYPEADCKPDLLAFSTPNGMLLQTAIEAFRKTVSANALGHNADRIARLDSIICDMERLYGCDCCALPIHCCTEIVD